MVQSWYGGWNIWVYTESAWESHIVLLYEWLQNYFKTKEPVGREWCKILQKARKANPSATTMLAVAQWQMSCLWKDLNTRKQHVENISQMCVKNSWGEAHYHATCRRDYTREDDRHQETVKDTKTIEEQVYKHYFQYIVQYVMGRIVWRQRDYHVKEELCNWNIQCNFSVEVNKW